MRNGSNALQHIYDYIQQGYSQHHTKWGKTETIYSKVRSKASVSILTTLIKHTVEISNQNNKIRRRNKRNSSRKRRIKMICICRRYEPPKRPRKLHQTSPRHLKHLQKRSRIQNQFTFLYNNNEQTEKKFRKTIPFTISAKKFQGMNLTKK
jgi:hypothetical protein